MDTYRLKQFCTIVETGSLTKAAQLLHVTHSALSKSMGALQKELHQKLLQADGRGVSITREGNQVYQNAKKLLELEHHLFHLKLGNDESKISIGMTEIFLPVLAEGIAKRNFGEEKIRLLEMSPGQIEQEVISGKIDYGITYAPVSIEGLEISEIRKFSSGCYYLEGKFDHLKISQIPFAVPALELAENPLNIQIRDGWPEALHPRNKRYFVNLLSVAIDLARRGLCAIYVPHFLMDQSNCKGENSLRLVERNLSITGIEPQTAYILRHKCRSEDSSFKRIYSIVREKLSMKHFRPFELQPRMQSLPD